MEGFQDAGKNLTQGMSNVISSLTGGKGDDKKKKTETKGKRKY